MKRLILLMLLSLSATLHAQQRIVLTSAKFSTGDDPGRMQPYFDDSGWPAINTNTVWEQQGYNYDGYAWYRFHFVLPLALKNAAYLKDSLRIFLSKIDDVDEAWLNGVKIGKTGRFPEDQGGYAGNFGAVREYYIPASNGALNWNGDNVLAVRVYDGSGNGGIFEAYPFIGMFDVIDRIEMNVVPGAVSNESNVTLINRFYKPVKGELLIEVRDYDNNKVINTRREPAILSPGAQLHKIAAYPLLSHVRIYACFKENAGGRTKELTITPPYILTPASPLTPRINGARIFGVRPGSPVLYRIAATGKKPLRYSIKGLPAGLQLNKNTGIITGALPREGAHKLKITVTNALGKTEDDLTISVGKNISLTPPMGWNSWNCWGISVNMDKVKASAQAMIDKGLAEHGWSYINIDDGWEAPKRAADSIIEANEKFPDMKGLADWLHGNGLKFGIYSSPGVLTCGRYLGSLGHEKEDARAYASWGVDYLKYDWCYYGEVFEKNGDTSSAAYRRPYVTMQKALEAQKRDIHYSLCQYGMNDVWKWGAEVNGNSWRTTGDIEDTWGSLSAIGFNQDKYYPYAKPGHWNDPDMLIVGQVGWGYVLRSTRLTPDEQYTHISLWCLLSAPLLIGCDISKLDAFTLNLLTNDEVLAIDQDVLGKQARRLLKNDSCQVWVKELSDGGKAVGIFNMGDTDQTFTVKWADIREAKAQHVRDLWRQKDVGYLEDGITLKIPPHGVKLVKLTK